MKQGLLLFFIALFLSISMKGQDILVQFEEQDRSMALNTIGGTAWYMYTIMDLRGILSYCTSMTGKPMLDSCIVLQHNPVLELRVGSRSRISDSALAAAALDTLIKTYNLHYVVSPSEMIEVISVTSVSQEIRYTQNSGTNMDTEGFWTLSNMEFNRFSTFFKTKGLLLKTGEENIKTRGLTFQIPNELVEIMPENRSEIIRLLDESGIHTEITKERLVYLKDGK